jgi:ferredoxin
MVIKINHKKCIGAEKCGKCLHICPLGVFMNVPMGKYIPHEKPKKYKIVPYFKDICNNCGACVKVCPERCISL